MASEYAVAVLREEENREGYVPEIVYLDEKSVPDRLNGERGFHILHVRMLTELILRELVQSGLRTLSEEDIGAMAVASALHDIGKQLVPKAILENPGRLSPVEYDIVKKHAALGAQIIEGTDFGEIDPLIKRYAAEICEGHHERYDGMGYPEGRKGEDIPLSAQVVALADTYDALTSDRSYKEAFSQDVAIQMISSGMCGVFCRELVDTLLRVVNHSALVSLREQLYKNRAVVAEQTGFRPARVLCLGNTEYIDESFIENAFPDSKVMVLGNTRLSSAERIKLFRIKKPSVQAVFQTYDFDLVVYFSGDLSYRTREKNDSEELREVLEAAKMLGREMKFIFLSSLDSAFKGRSDRAILSAAKESLCDHYAKTSELDVKVVQIPYLYSGTYQKDFLYGLFAAMHSKKTVQVDLTARTRLHFISLSDLAGLLYRLVENWKQGGGVLSVTDEFGTTFAELAERLQQICGPVDVDCVGSTDGGQTTLSNRAIRNEYGWFAKISVLEDAEEEHEKYLASVQGEKRSGWARFRQWMEKHSPILKAAELILLFLLTELLLLWTDSAVIFAIVDFRMVYVVVMATAHGLYYGLASAGLSSLSWLVAKVLSGTGLLTVFYEPTNWLPFVFYFLVAAVCGYIKLRKEDTIRFVTEQNTLLEDKLVFTREIYEDTHREKRDLKKQIIGSKDSFGKIFDITRKLDTVAPQLLYLRTVETFEEILENRSVTVYSVNKQSSFGRLEVASRDIIDTVSRSMSVETYAEVIDALAGGEIWRNTDLKPGYPMYAAGVLSGTELALVIFLWNAGPDQRSLYYVNLFRILRDLVQMSLLRALDYNRAVYEKQYLAGTRIMRAEAYAEVLENYEALAEKKVSNYVRLGVESDGYGIEQLEGLLAGKIRASDVVGIGKSGGVEILLAQASSKDLQFILPRFEGGEIRVTVLSATH